MNDAEYLERIEMLLGELFPITQHSDLVVFPTSYNKKTDTLYTQVQPASPPKWAYTAHEFANHEGMKYDRDSEAFRVDGQPRVGGPGLVWVRYVGPFVDGSRVGLHIWSQQPSHEEAEQQLSELYGRFMELDGLEPIEVFRKFMK